MDTKDNQDAIGQQIKEDAVKKTLEDALLNAKFPMRATPEQITYISNYLDSLLSWSADNKVPLMIMASFFGAYQAECFSLLRDHEKLQKISSIIQSLRGQDGNSAESPEEPTH